MEDREEQDNREEENNREEEEKMEKEDREELTWRIKSREKADCRGCGILEDNLSYGVTNINCKTFLD